MASPSSRQQHSPRKSGRTVPRSGERNGRERLGGPENVLPRSHALSVDTGTAAARQAVEANDSDSETDNYRSHRRHKRPNILQSGRELLGRLGVSRDYDDDGDDDDEYYSPMEDFPPSPRAAGRARIPREDDSDGSGECEILTDDEDDDLDVSQYPTRTRQQDIAEMLDVASPRSSVAQKDIAALKSMFADKHPWRRQSRRESNKVYSSQGPRLPSANRLDDEVAEPALSLKASLRERISGLSILPSRSDEEEDESSSSSEDEASSTQSSVSIISDQEDDDDLDFSALEYLPNSFTSHPEFMSAYMDASGMSLSEQDSSMFAYEHSLLLRAVLQLLAERDYFGVEADIDDPFCIVKKGPLKKATHSVGRTAWRVKYVEIRPGSFSYFEDSGKRNNFGRKTIPLRSSKSKCQSINGNLFALEVDGGPRRVWMTNSDDECQAWMRAVQDAMIGGGAGDSTHSLDVSQYQVALDQFQQAQSKLVRAVTLDDYMASVEGLLRTNIRIPSQWVSSRASMGSRTERLNDGKASSSQKRSSVSGFLKRLKQQDAFSINGCFVSANSPRAAERIIGALARCILELDKSSPVEGRVPLSELQALSFSRDILVSVLRSRSRDEARACLQYLCSNPKLVAVKSLAGPESVAPLCFEANYAIAETEENPEKDISGWLATRTRFKGIWRNRFLVISDGILNIFEHSSPRPHGLRGQILLSEADVSVVKDLPKNEAHLHILRIVSKNKESERQLLFPDEALLEEWKNVVEKTIDLFTSPSSDEDEPEVLVTPRASMIPAAGGRIIQGASESGVKIIKGATDQFIKATDMIRSSMRSSGKSGGTAVHSRSSSVDMWFATSKHGSVGGSKHGDRGEAGVGDSFALNSSFESEAIPKQEPTVQITAECTSMFKIVSSPSSSVSHKSSNDSQDSLVTAKVKFLHTFLLAGGSHGRLSKGDELVEMEFHRSPPVSEEAGCSSAAKA